MNRSHLAVEEPRGPNTGGGHKGGGHKEGLLGVEILTCLRTLGQEIQFDRAVGDVAQSQTHHFTEEGRGFLQLLDVDRGINLNITKWTEVLDRQVELFLKKLSGIGHHRAATAEVNSLRSRSGLLGPVKLHRLVDLHVQAGQDVPGDLGNGGYLRIIRFLVSTAQTDETLGNLELFSLSEGCLGFGRIFLSNGVCTDGDRADVKLVFLEEEDVAGFSTDIDQQTAALDISVVVTEGVGQCGHRRIHHFHLQANRFTDCEELFNHLGLNSHQQHLTRPIGSGAQNLMVPSTFGQRERNVLLGLVLDDLRNLRSVNRGQFDKFREDLITRRRNVGLAGNKTTLSQKLTQGTLQHTIAGSILGAGEPEGANAKAEELQTAAVGGFEFGDLQGASPEVDPQKCFGF